MQERQRLANLEARQLEEEKQREIELKKAEKRKGVLDKKEEQLKNDEEKLEKTFDVATRMLRSAQAQMDEAISNSDMVGVQVSCELIDAATKKLEVASKHREEQSKIRTDIGKKRKIAFNKLFKVAKKSK